MKMHLVLEIQFRDGAQRPFSWPYEKCIAWLEANARKVGQDCLPAMPTDQASVQGGDDARNGKLRIIPAVMAFEPLLPTLLGSTPFSSPTTLTPTGLSRSLTAQPRTLNTAATTTTSGGTTPTQSQDTRWSKNCIFRLANSIIDCRDDYIAYYGTAAREVVDARDVSGPWEAIALVYNNPESNPEVDENLLPGDHNVTGHIGNQSDFFVCRHQSTAAVLKKHHDDYKGFINSGIVNKTKSGQGDTDAPSEIERLVEEEADSRKVVADDENWVELEEAVRQRMYSNPTGNNIISYVRGDIGLYYMWVLFEMHNLTRFINMRVAPEESCTSTGATRSAVDAGRVSKRGTKRAKPADEKTETLKACVAALNTTLKELGSASTTTATDSLVAPELG